MRADHPMAPTFVLEAPDDRAVRRLATLCQMRVDQFLRRFDVRYVFPDGRPAKGWDQLKAEAAGVRLSATFQRDKRVVAVGRAGSVLDDHSLLFKLLSPGLTLFWDDLPARLQTSSDLRAFLGIS